MSLSALGRTAAAVVVVAVVLAYAVPLMSIDVNPYDEGVVALGAEQVLKGHRPAIDFYTPYPPGVFYALAGLYRLAGVRLMVERQMSVGLVAACVLLGFLLVTALRPRHERRAAAELLSAGFTLGIAGVVMAVTWMTPVTSGALCLLLLAGIGLREALRRGHPLAGFATGLLFGLTALWRSTFGLYGIVAAVAVWLLRAGLADGDDRPGGRRRVIGAAAMLFGAALVALPVFALLVYLGGPRAFKSLFIWPLVSTQMATLPWPPLIPKLPVPAPHGPSAAFLQQAALICRNWAYYLPLAAVLFGAWRLCRWRSLAPAEINVGLWLLLTSVGFALYASRRTDYIHVLPLLLFSLLFVALCLAGALAERPEPRSWRRVPWMAAGLVLALPALAALLPSPIQRWVAQYNRPRRCLVELPGPRGAGISTSRFRARQYGDVLAYVDRVIPEGEKIYSGTSRHDLFMVNDVMLYFLAERDPGTYFWATDAGVTSDPGVQEEMTRELRAKPVNWAVLWLASSPERTNEAGLKPGAALLDQTLAREFVPVERLSWYTVLRRVGGGQPTAPMSLSSQQPSGPDRDWEYAQRPDPALSPPSPVEPAADSIDYPAARQQSRAPPSRTGSEG